MAKKQALGRGLDSLIPNIEEKTSSLIQEINLELIETNPYQPRTLFEEQALSDLSNSIKEIGIIQPITLRALDNGKYQIISGERRCRASKIAGLTSVPAFIRTANDEEMLEMALVENIQREDLNAIEVAISYQRLIDECNLTHEQLSAKMGKERSTITNFLRLLNLPAKIQNGIVERKISMGHARALLSIKDEETMLMVYDQIQKYDFSVRKVEETAKALSAASNATENPQQIQKTKKTSDDDYLSLQKQLSKSLEATVAFKRNSKGDGKIIIPFKNDDDLERILGLLDKINT